MKVNEMIIFPYLLRKIVPSQRIWLVIQWTSMDPKHSIIKGLHYLRK